MVEGEEEDDFGELYWDVLQPLSSQNGRDGKAETLKCEREEKEDVGSVRLEIYLGSRRVLENSFVFSLGKKKKKKKKKNGNHDSKCDMVGRDEIGAEGDHHGTGRIISPDRPVSGSEEGELISDAYNNNNNNKQNTRHVETSRPMVLVNRYPYLSSTSLFDLDLESLEYRPWRRQDLSHYFNYGLNETSWKIYCHQLRSVRINAGKQIQQGEDEPTATIQVLQKKKKNVQRSVRIYAGKQIQQGEDEPTATIQNKCYRTFLQGNNNNQQQQDNNSKRPKLVEVEDDESWSNMSDNEWMCRNVGTDSWFHPIRHHHHQEEEEESDRKRSRKGRSKLERWTRHDPDENTSTSTSSPPAAH